MLDSDPACPPRTSYYAAPADHQGRPFLGTFVGILGIAAGLVALVTLFWAAMVLIKIASGTREYGGGAADMAKLFVFAVICLFVAVRWCRAACRMWAGR